MPINLLIQKSAFARQAKTTGTERRLQELGQGLAQALLHGRHEPLALSLNLGDVVCVELRQEEE